MAWRSLTSLLPAGLAGAAFLAACTGTIGGPEDEISVPEEGVPEAGARRLTAYEYDNALADLLLDDTRPGAVLLPEDPRTPFDNDYTSQAASKVLIEAAEFLATDAAARLIEDPPRRDAVVGCTPDASVDETCMRRFVERFGRRALRRPLSGEEVDSYLTLGSDVALGSDDFYQGVEVMVSAFLQDAAFLYRVELGTAVPRADGVYRLTPFEVATRMSMLIWGTIPDDALLDLAQGGALDTSAAIASAAATMLDDGRARKQLERFHAMWLGFEALPHAPELTNAMRTETAALLNRVIFEEQTSWLELFRASESFIDDDLALHYGLTPPGSDTPRWVDVSASGRKGILSHGSVLSVAANVGDTSPTKRGKYIREQLMCQSIPPPPPDVMADEPPSESLAECKWDQYEVHRVGSCKACHQQMDLIGFGLERYDREGKYRAHDDGKPQCTIAGDGEIVGVGSFNGPGELGDLLTTTGLLEACAVEQLYSYALGRAVEPDDVDRVASLAARFAEDGYLFKDLVMTLVSDASFAFRREEKVED